MNLFPYQKEGVELLEKGYNLLCDDQGLGKTIEIAKLIEHTNSRRVLIVCPNTLKINWYRELHKWCIGDNAIMVLDGSTEKKLNLLWEFYKYQSDTSRKILITNYDGLIELQEELRTHWDLFVLDESHWVKNRKSKGFAAAKLISKYSYRTIPCTGTPFLNATTDIWALLHLAYPKEFSAYWKFADNYCNVYKTPFGHSHLVVEEIFDPNHPKKVALREMLSTKMIRREKQEVLKELPPKTICPIYIDLTDEQRAIYDQMEQEMFALVDGEPVFVNITVAQIISLIQICLSPSLLIETAKQIEGAKITATLELLNTFGEDKVVIFSEWAEPLIRLKKRISNAVLLTGAITKTEDRQVIIDKFKTDPKVKVLLATIKAGGVGLTLTEANKCIFLNKDLVSKINLQAQDRLCRIGQTKPVTIYELICEDTIEEDLELLLFKKDFIGEINTKEGIEELPQDMVEQLKIKILSRRLNNE